MATASRNDRLHAIVAKVNPPAAAAYAKTGQWPQVGKTGQGARINRCPYVIVSLADGRRQVRVMSADGDVVSGVGATVGDALTALDEKVGLKAAETAGGAQ